MMRPSSHVLVCAALVLCSTAAAAQDRPSLGAVARGRAQTARQQVADAIAFSTEQEWIVADVAGAIQQMTAFAARTPVVPGPISVKTLSPSAGTLPRFDVRVPGSAAVTIAVAEHLWAPAAYAPLAASLSGRSSACAASTTAPVVAAMLDPRAATILKENDRISARLQADVRCADAHDEAALLLGTFALREAAGGFSDPRRLMSRMTAHLAVADALGKDAASATRRLADAVLLTLAGRQQSALDTLSTLAGLKPDRDVQAWMRALRLRNTFDWRDSSDAVPASLLEQLSLLRALEATVGEGPSLDMYDRLENTAEVPDWARILLQVDFGVEAGNRFTDEWMTAELTEASQALHAFDPAAALDDRESIVRELNVEPTAGPVQRDGSLRVIDRGTWTAAAQRHLLSAMVVKHSHWYGKLGLQDDARAFRDDASRLFSGLRLYPVAASIMAGSRQEITRILRSAVPLLQSRPDLITDWTWRKVSFSARFAALEPPRDAAAWFTPLFPAGTTFDSDSRSNPDGDKPRLSATEVAQLRRLAPYSRRLIQEAVRWGGEKPSYEQLRTDFGRLAAYDIGFARTLARAAWDRPEIYIRQMELVCRMSADGYWDLAPYLADHGRVDEARRAYETWLATGRSQVAISNAMDWLVRDYFDRGEHEKAIAVADRVAGVGSYGGIVTRANLLEWLGDLEGAEREHRKAWLRYDNPNELLAFYLRQHRRGPEVDELIAAVFPAGLTRTVSAANTTPPLDGVVVTFPGVIGMQEGVHENDVLTAVDGIRVRDFAQFRVAMGSSADETVRITLWRNGKSLEVSARLRRRWIVSSLETYTPKPPSPPSSPARR